MELVNLLRSVIDPPDLCRVGYRIPYSVQKWQLDKWPTSAAAGTEGQTSLASPRLSLFSRTQSTLLNLTILHKAKERNAIGVECVVQALQRAGSTE